MNKKIYTITELNSSIKRILEPNFDDIWVEGEISNWNLHQSGHAYFSLKDDNSQIQAVFFNFNENKFELNNGLKVIARGRISLYLKSGKHQLVLSCIEPRGKGALQLAFEQLKQKLQKEGLFDDARKKTIPMLPQKIGLVTSPSGAAIKDILTVINRRFANVHILIYPVSVQGDNAKYEISEAIKYLNKNEPDIDVMLVGRGGGSYEDLWAFNEELVARAIFDSKIPVISCVGHEIDFTIADFVADVRAPTPSAAAEIAVKNKIDIENKISRLYFALKGKISHMSNFYSEKLKMIRSNKYLRNPFEYFLEYEQNIDSLSVELSEKVQRMITDRSRCLETLEKSLSTLSPSSIAEFFTLKLDALYSHIKRSMSGHIVSNEHRTNAISSALNNLSPLSILSRGYSIVWKLPEKILLKSAKDVKLNDEVGIKLKEGSFIAAVKKIADNDI